MISDSIIGSLLTASVQCIEITTAGKKDANLRMHVICRLQIETTGNQSERHGLRHRVSEESGSLLQATLRHGMA